MAKLLAKSLTNKKVMLTDGSLLGTATNVIVDMKTGKLIDLVVKPDPAIDTSKYRFEDGFVLISFEAVRAAKDYAIVDKNIASQGSAIV